MNTPIPGHKSDMAELSLADPADSPPDWASIAHVVECPLCEYNLYGLTQPRCPECGLDFNWPQVLDPNRQRHPYLFEHHPERGFASFFQTLAGGLRPKRFWTTLHPAQRSAGRRLIFYALIILGLAVFPLALARITLPAPPAGSFYISDTLRYDFMRAFLGSFPLWLLRPFFYGPVSKTVPYLVVACTLLPFMNYVLLLIFQGTMQRVRVRHHHVLRCIVYSSDVLIWSSSLLCLLLPINLLMHGGLDELVAWTVLLLLPIIWITIAWRLTVAYRRYLRFHHAEAAVLSVQIILFLLALFALLGVRFW
jgi:hypothetical protein